MTQVSSALARSASEFVAGLVEALTCAFDTLRPKILEFAEAVNQLQEGPPVRGYEPLFREQGIGYSESRLIASGLVRYADQLKEENRLQRAVSSVFRRLAKAAGKSTLVISRRAEELRRALDAPRWVGVINSALYAAGRPESVEDLRQILDHAVRRDCAACGALTDLAPILIAHLPDPRGRPLSLATADHQLLLRYFERSGKPVAYTWNDLPEGATCGDFVDKATLATREATGDASFDPRPARRRLKARHPR